METKVPVSLLLEGGLLRLRQVLSLVPVSKSSWWAGVKAGIYPAGLRLGKRMTVWKAVDIKRLIDSLSAEGTMAA